MTKNISSISISGELTLNMHSLNNEGGEGNQILTRQVTIVDKQGKEWTVSGISGDMFKHIHAKHLINYCVENKLPISDLSKTASPDRISASQLNAAITRAEVKQEEIVDAMIATCTITDIHGVLMTGDVKGIKNTPKKSIIEFGWLIGIPEKNTTDSYFHSKNAPNENPVPFNRPANSGQYAFVCNIEAFRIGLNEQNRKYTNNIDRVKRYKATLQALLSSFINPQGAMTSSQKPHITDFKGVVTYSEKLIPAPTISPINPGYEKEVQTIAANLNEIEPGAITVKEFNGLGALSEIIKDLMAEEPYKLN
jgi:CRISPR-associated protein Cst2